MPPATPRQQNASPSRPITPTLPRLITYHQGIFHSPNQTYTPILPLLENHTGLTHLIIAAIHVNHPPGNIHLNDDPATSPKFAPLWPDLRTLQSHGIKILGLLGGAARGSFIRLDSDEASFRAYYEPLRDVVRYMGLDGLDLDVEEDMSLEGIIRLILTLRADFSPGFLITLAPVATAMMEPRVPNPDFEDVSPKEPVPRQGVGNLSGFSYQALEKAVGREVAWYNTQFYCGWGDLWTPLHYAQVIEVGGWDPRKIVVGTVTNPMNGAGWTPDRMLRHTLLLARDCAGDGEFGGVMGWEYFNSVVSSGRIGGRGGDGATERIVEGRPWEWVKRIGGILRGEDVDDTWDEKMAVWDGRFGEGGAGRQDGDQRWR